MRTPPPKYIVIGAGIVIVISLWSLLFSHTKKVNPAPFIGVGEVLADETAKTLADKGQVVVLVSSAQNDSHSLQHHEVDGFLHEMKKHPQIQIVATETRTFGEAPSEDPEREVKTAYEQLLNKYQKADALVTFIGLPAISPEEPLELPPIHPKILAAHLAPTQGQAYLRDKVIVAFIANREGRASTTNSKPHTRREWFDSYYQLFTSKDVDVVSESK